MLSIWVAAALLALGRGQYTVYEGSGLAPSGYHLCVHNETRTVSFLAMHKVPYTATTPCGGWLLWKTCTVTLYKMIHQTEYKIVMEQVIKCCDGYVQVGRYCALRKSVNRSGEVIAKPGSCPTTDGLYPGSEECELDMDCPGWQKCCQRLGRCFCSHPTNSTNDSDRSRLNTTVTVKTDYQQLMSKDKGLLNHTRLLQAMVCSANAIANIISITPSTTAYKRHTSAPCNMAQCPFNLFIYYLSLLYPPKIFVSVFLIADVDECVEDSSLYQCSPYADCINTLGSYECTCRQGYVDVDPHNPGARCTGETVCVKKQSYQVAVRKGSEDIQLWETSQTMMEVRGLQPGVLYNVTVTPCACGNQGDPLHITVKTDAQTLDATARLTNIQVDFLVSFTFHYFIVCFLCFQQIYQSLSPEMKAMVDSGRVRIEIRSFSLGSVVVNFALIFTPNQSQDISNVSVALLNSLMNSSTYTVDRNKTNFDECVSGENDCSQWATCRNTWASYTCVCPEGLIDNDPERPGRSCQGRVSQSGQVDFAQIKYCMSLVASITVTVTKDFLLNNTIQESALYLGMKSCGINGSNDTHVQLTVPWNKCGTQLVHVSSFINSEKNSPFGIFFPMLIGLCGFMAGCTLFSPISRYNMIKDVIMGLGSFQVTVQLMNGTVPLPHNYSLSSEEVVVVEVSLNTSSEQIKVVINKCWATPTPNPADSYSYPFLENSCSLNTYAKVLMNGNSSTSRVAVQIFSLVNVNVIYLHCQVHICVQLGSDTCVPVSASASASFKNSQNSYSPLQIFMERMNLTKKYPTSRLFGFSCLGIGLTLFFIIALVCLFYCQRNRIGHYNFSVKPKEENFTYLVFNA
uniref:Uromodulin-like 1 n=1 Tax=Echeneis naucrates TaxID=173247 RepID=A0A665W2Q2_ECHNA